MKEEDVWTPPEPTAADFELLERIAARRAALTARPAADRHEEVLRRHLLAILDRMEEEVCVHGHREAAEEIAAGWRRLAVHERRQSGNDGAAVPAGAHRRRRTVRRRRAPRSTPEAPRAAAARR